MVAPAVTNVTSTTANGSWWAGTIMLIQVTFDQSVTVTGTPRILMGVGQTTYATYESGSPGTVITFSYTVVAGDNSSDLDYAATNSLGLNGGTIKDTLTGLVSATLTLPATGGAGSLAGNKALIVDTTAATVDNVTSAKANGTYGVGEVIDITVHFTETVIVTGTPRLILATNPARMLLYLSGSGSATLTFRYTVASPDHSADLDYVSTIALALFGGTIKDAAGNSATLTLPAPGAAGSLGANKALVIATPGVSGGAGSATGAGLGFGGAWGFGL